MSSHFYYFFAKNKAYLVLEIGFVSDLSRAIFRSRGFLLFFVQIP